MNHKPVPRVTTNLRGIEPVWRCVVCGEWLVTVHTVNGRHWRHGPR